MSRRAPVTPGDFAGRLARQVVRSAGEWLCDDSSAAAASVDIPLHPPVTPVTDADARSAAEFTRAWQLTADEWRGLGLAASVEWAERRRGAWGTQPVPQRAAVAGADAIAQIAGRGTDWRRWLRRRDLLVAADGGDGPGFRAALGSTWRKWSELSDGDVTRLRDVVGWFLANPDSGLLPRAVAVRGVDGKWLERHRDLVTRLVAGARAANAGAADVLGLTSRPRTIRIRLLDPGLGPGWPSTDISAPIADLATAWDSGTVRTAIIVENLETFLSLPAGEFGPGAVAVWGAGYGAGELARLRWLAGAQVLYWGDLDAHGFGILDGLRAAAADLDVGSVLMDTATFREFADLAVPDPSPTRRPFTHLTAGEAAALESLILAGDLRLEQERIPWPHALRVLRAAVTG